MNWEIIHAELQQDVKEYIKTLSDEQLLEWWMEGTPIDRYSAIEWMYDEGEYELAKRLKNLGHLV